MSDFTTKLYGIKCICRVKHYRPRVPAKTDGPPEDCYPAEEAEFEYDILNLDGTPAPDAEVTGNDEDRLIDEYELHVTAIKHDMEL